MQSSSNSEPAAICKRRNDKSRRSSKVLISVFCSAIYLFDNSLVALIFLNVVPKLLLPQEALNWLNPVHSEFRNNISVMDFNCNETNHGSTLDRVKVLTDRFCQVFYLFLLVLDQFF